MTDTAPVPRGCWLLRPVGGDLRILVGVIRFEFLVAGAEVEVACISEVIAVVLIAQELEASPEAHVEFVSEVTCGVAAHTAALRVKREEMRSAVRVATLPTVAKDSELTANQTQ